jgi:hypothetical protein
VVVDDDDEFHHVFALHTVSTSLVSYDNETVAPCKCRGASSSSSTVNVARTVRILLLANEVVPTIPPSLADPFAARNLYESDDDGDASLVAFGDNGDDTTRLDVDDCTMYALIQPHVVSSLPRFREGRNPFGNVP